MFHEISGLEQPVATINQRRTVLGFISWIIMGLIVGVLAKLIMPGKDPGGLFITIGIGIAGAFVGGFIGAKLGFGAVTGFNIGSILIATGGAVLLLAIYRAMKKKQ
jgi:uncharacterized membrane protein YeaQ/YmgE (transglycosylase-associated protein family)